jgi:hypothetical protein
MIGKRHRVRRYPFLLILLLHSIVAIGEPTYSVAPGVFTLDLENARTSSVLLTNTGDARIRLMVRPVYYPIDSRTFQGGKRLNPDFNQKDDISKSIIVSPRIVVLAPGQKRYARFSIRHQGDLDPGDYRAHLLIRILEGRETDQQAAPEESTGGMNIQLSFRLETAVAVYGRIGTPDTQLELQCTQESLNALTVVTKNTSVWNYRGWIGVFEDVTPPF